MTITIKIGLKGSSTSGNYGHAGRRGKIGGSVPKSTGAGGESDPRGDLQAATDVGIYGTSSYKKYDIDAMNALKRGDNTKYGDFEDDHVKSVYKNEIVTELSEATGLPYDDVNKFVHQWANSSNDTDMRSLSIQKAIADEFGLELSPWQKQRMTDLKYPNQKIAIYQRQKDKVDNKYKQLIEDRNMLSFQLYQAHKSDNKTEEDRLQNLYDKAASRQIDLEVRSSNLSSRILELRDIGTSQMQHIFSNRPNPDADARKLVRAMYNNQQAKFKAAGITEITLFRGTKLPLPKQQPKAGDTVNFKGNVAESWSANHGIADGFAGYRTAGYASMIVAVKVPAGRVLTSAATGLGCLNEKEYIVIGSRFSNDKAYISKYGTLE